MEKMLIQKTLQNAFEWLTSQFSKRFQGGLAGGNVQNVRYNQCHVLFLLLHKRAGKSYPTYTLVEEFVQFYTEPSILSKKKCTA